MAIKKPKAETVVIYTSEEGRKYSALVLKSWVCGDGTDENRKLVKGQIVVEGTVLVDLVYVHEEDSNGKDGTLTIENSVPRKRPGMKGGYWEYPRKNKD